MMTSDGSLRCGEMQLHNEEQLQSTHNLDGTSQVFSFPTFKRNDKYIHLLDTIINIKAFASHILKNGYMVNDNFFYYL